MVVARAKAAPLLERTFARRIVFASPGQRQATAALQSVRSLLLDGMRSTVREQRWSGARWLDGEATPSA